MAVSIFRDACLLRSRGVDPERRRDGKFIAPYNYTKTGQALALGQGVARRFDADEYELYAQDTWKAARTLTFTYGVRWSLMPPIHEATGTQTSTRVPLSDFFAQRVALADNGQPQSSVAPVEYPLRGGLGAGQDGDSRRLGALLRSDWRRFDFEL